MNKVVLAKNLATITGASFAAYLGIETGRYFGEFLPNGYMLSELAQGFTAVTCGGLANNALRKLLGSKSLLANQAYSTAALIAFANTENESRGVTTAQSLEEISKNLVEVYTRTNKGGKFKYYSGSGLMITSDGYVITAHHVIKDAVTNKGQIVVRDQKRRSYPVNPKNVLYDKRTDIAILKARKITAYPAPMKILVNQVDDLRKGDEVRVMGYRDGQPWNPIGVIKNPKTRWQITEDRVIDDVFQTDAKVLGGQSGGVVVNGRGELVGIVLYSKPVSGEEVGLLGGGKILNALIYINQIAAANAGRMF